MKDNTIEPLAAQGWLASHEMQVESTKPHASEGANEVQLSLQWFPIVLGLASASTPQFKLKDLLVGAGCLQECTVGIPVDEVSVLTGAMGAQASEKLH